MASAFLAGFPQGLMQGLEFNQLQQQRAAQQAFQQYQLQQAMQQQQAMGALAAGIGPALSTPAPMMPYAPPTQMPYMPQQGGQAGGGFAAGGALPMAAGAGTPLAQMFAGIESGNNPNAPISPTGNAGILQQGLPFQRQFLDPSLTSITTDPSLQSQALSNFAGQAVAQNPNLTAKDLYGEYAGGTGSPGRGPTFGEIPSAYQSNFLRTAAAQGIDPNAPAASLFNNQVDRLLAAGRPWAAQPMAVQQQMDGAQVPSETHLEAAQGAKDAAAEFNPLEYGRIQMKAAWDAIDQQPISPQAKVMALMYMQQIMAPQDKLMTSMVMMQNRDMLGMARLGTAQAGEAERERHDIEMERLAGGRGQIFQQPDGSFVSVTPQGAKPIPGLAPGATKAGTAAQQPPKPEQVTPIAHAIAEYRMAPLTGWTLRSPWGQAVMQEVQKENPNYDQTKYVARARGAVAFTTGRQGDTVRSFSVAMDHLALMSDVSTALANNDVQSLNRLGNAIKKEFGYAGPVDFNFVKAIVGDEVSKAIIGGVGAATDRQQLQNGFDLANSPEQLAGVSDMAKRLIAGQLAGLRRQGERTGFSAEEFDKALSDYARQQMEEYEKMLPQATGGGPAARASGGNVPTVTKDQYDKLPSGAAYKTPGSNKVFYKQ